MKSACLVLLLTLPALSARAGDKMVVDLQSSPIGASPAGWTFGRTGQGRAGSWVVEE